MIDIQDYIKTTITDTLVKCARLVGEHDFKEIERQLMCGFMEAAAEATGYILSLHDIDTPYVEHDGKRYYKSSRHAIEYFTCAGKVKVERTNYRDCDYGIRRICPMDLKAGIVNGNWTPQAAKVATLATAEMTPYTAEKLFSEMGALKTSKSSLDRLAKRINASLEPNGEFIANTILANSSIPDDTQKMSVSIDGVHIAIQKLKGKSRFIKDRSFRLDRGKMIAVEETYSRYREASCGTVSYLDKNGKVLRTCYYGKMPQEHKLMLKDRLELHVKKVLETHPELELVAVADGAKDNWTFIEKAFPTSIKILDFYHAAEHLNEAIRHMGLNEQEAKHTFEKQRSILRYQSTGIDKVIRFLTARYQLRKNEKLRREINYFKSNRKRCFYLKHANHNRPIGSGTVEAACKCIVAKRLKCSGMAWRWKGGQAILNFRSCLKSNLFDELWQALESIYKSPVVAVVQR